MTKKTPMDKHQERAAKAWKRRDEKILCEYLDAITDAVDHELPRDPAAAYEMLDRRLAGLKKGIQEKRERAKELHNREYRSLKHD